MNNIEIIVIIVIISIIFLVSINSCSHINNILLNINNNSVRFIMILFIIIIGKYNVIMAGLAGLLFLIMINKANQIEGLENNNNNKYKSLNIWLGVMLINPIKYILFNDKYDIKQEIEEIKLTNDCKLFTEKYIEIMDNDMVQSIAILLDATKSENNIHNILSLFNRLKYEEMIIDFEKLLNDEEIIENIIQENMVKLDKNKIKRILLPLLKNNIECAQKLFYKASSNYLSVEYITKMMNGPENENKTDENDQNNSNMEYNDELMEEDDCNNGNVCSKGFYCVSKKKGIGSKYLCSPFMNPVLCRNKKFSCPNDSKCIRRQKCEDYDGNLTDQVMNSDGYTKKNISESTEVMEEKTSEIDSSDNDIPIAKSFPTLKNSFDIDNHNQSYTSPINNYDSHDKHDFHKIQNVIKDCK